MLCEERIVDTEKIIDIIKNRKERQAQIRKKIQEVYEEMELAETESIECVMLSTDYEKVGIYVSKQFDMLRILEEQKKRERQYNLELRIKLCGLQDDLSMIQRVWFCYNALPYEQHEILKKLYEENEAWASAEKAMGMNHRIFYKKRKEAIYNIIHWYHSNMTNVEIIKFSGR